MYEFIQPDIRCMLQWYLSAIGASQAMNMPPTTPCQATTCSAAADDFCDAASQQCLHHEMQHQNFSLMDAA
jgi:hypothetical protein